MVFSRISWRMTVLTAFVKGNPMHAKKASKPASKAPKKRPSKKVVGDPYLAKQLKEVEDLLNVPPRQRGVNRTLRMIERSQNRTV
jgi:hypothetical protein